MFCIDCNTVLISVQSAVYNHLTNVVAIEMPSEQEIAISHELSPEADDTFYRFGGAAIASMLHKCYRHMHSCPYGKRGSVVDEITVIKAIECLDKTVIPASLQYRDRGFIYFPDENFLPFIKKVDEKIRKIANWDGIEQHGQKIIEVATNQIQSDSLLRTLFNDFLSTRFDSLEGKSGAVDSVYNTILRKLCNTRLADFIDGYRQSKASKNGSASLSEQNLRDKLLSQHCSIKSQFENILPPVQ